MLSGPLSGHLKKSLWAGIPWELLPLLALFTTPPQDEPGRGQALAAAEGLRGVVDGPDRRVQYGGALADGAGGGVVQQGGGDAVPALVGRGVDAFDAGYAAPDGRCGAMTAQPIPSPARQAPHISQRGGRQADVNETGKRAFPVGHQQDAVAAAPFGHREPPPVGVGPQAEEIRPLFLAGDVVHQEGRQRGQVATGGGADARRGVRRCREGQRALEQPEARRESQFLVASALRGIGCGDGDP